MASHSFTDETVERALRALVLADMRPKVARQRLLADGIDIAERTLRDWKTVHADRLDTLATTRSNWASEGAAERGESIVTAGYGLMGEQLQALMEEDWSSMSITSRTRALAEVSKIVNAAVEKTRLLRDQPTQISENRSLAELVRGLAKYDAVFPGLKDSPLIQGTAEDITDEDDDAPPALVSADPEPEDDSGGDAVATADAVSDEEDK